MGAKMDEKTAIVAISKAYPFFDRERHPYKQWLKEVAIAKAFLKAKLPVRGFTGFAERYEAGNRSIAQNKPSPGQINLLQGL
jgi:hypothetical protein